MKAMLALTILAFMLYALPSQADISHAVAAAKQGDYKTAIHHLHPAAMQGNARAQSFLGSIYARLGNYDEALAWTKLAANQGDAVAQTHLGSMYEQGQGIGKDYREAVRWYQRAAEQQHPAAQFRIGVMYENGLGTGQDYKEAANWYRKAAEQGNAQALNALGILYGRGTGVDSDSVIAFMLFDLAEKFGSTPARHDAAATNGAIANRKRIQTMMTSEQFEKGQALSTNWKVGHPLPISSTYGQE